MKKLLLLLTILTFTISNAQAEEPFINIKNVQTITLKQVKTALKNGANVNAKDRRGNTSLLIASGWNSDPKIIELLLKHGANANDKNVMTALMFASFDNPNPKVVEVLLNHGANVNDKNSSGRTALMFATIKNSHLKRIELLLNHGADVNVKDVTGDTALIWATNTKETANPQIIKALLKHGAKPSKKLLTYIDTKCKDPKIISLFKKYPR